MKQKREEEGKITWICKNEKCPSKEFENPAMDISDLKMSMYPFSTVDGELLYFEGAVQCPHCHRFKFDKCINGVKVDRI